MALTILADAAAASARRTTAYAPPFPALPGRATWLKALWIELHHAAPLCSIVKWVEDGRRFWVSPACIGMLMATHDGCKSTSYATFTRNCRNHSIYPVRNENNGDVFEHSAGLFVRGRADLLPFVRQGFKFPKGIAGQRLLDRLATYNADGASRVPCRVKNRGAAMCFTQPVGMAAVPTSFLPRPAGSSVLQHN